jgi:hypothetical protein
VVKHHAFEFSVSVEAKNDSHDIVDGKQANRGEPEGNRWVTRVKGSWEGSILDDKPNNVEVREEVDWNVYHVERQAAEIHLRKRTEQDGNIDQFVQTTHKVNEA